MMSNVWKLVSNNRFFRFIINEKYYVIFRQFMDVGFKQH